MFRIVPRTARTTDMRRMSLNWLGSVVWSALARRQPSENYADRRDKLNTLARVIISPLVSYSTTVIHLIYPLKLVVCYYVQVLLE